MKPIIGITCATMTSPRTGLENGRIYIERNYVDRVAAAGGAPVLIPPGIDGAAIGPLLDGLVIPGGNDIDPAAWGEPLHPEADLEYPGRTAIEQEVFANLRPEAPVLGICYGCQLVNVILGGSLEQHMPDRLGHDDHRKVGMQDYRVVEGSRLAGIVGPQARGDSSHHQAVARTGRGLVVSAWHEDGTVEAIESTEGRWFLGLQWHPERSDVPESDLLFEAFVQAVIAAKAARV
ncbi:MAG: gamma-glutamyl-gamma-aminobutyrate hydrolase family protein [Armatimonadetes bacterium]|nr:gamma-glutamyl-gamma-aminobutyrate hydrolase family protein [Armatimonadota bacterium]